MKDDDGGPKLIVVAPVLGVHHSIGVVGPAGRIEGWVAGLEGALEAEEIASGRTV